MWCKSRPLGFCIWREYLSPWSFISQNFSPTNIWGYKTLRGYDNHFQTEGGFVCVGLSGNSFNSRHMY